MTSDDLADLTKTLEKTKVDERKELSFKGRGLKLNNKEDAKEIIDAMNECETMTSLRLEGNTLGVGAAEAIAGALGQHPEIQRALWSDMFTGRLKSEIPQALKHLGSAMMLAEASLVELDLSDNAFGPNGVEGIVDLLKSKTCYTLKELRLNNNGLGTTGGKMLARCLMDCYKASSAAGTPLALKVFISGRGRLENEGSTALSEVFKLMGSLEYVSMPQNGINHQGITALANAFADNPNLHVLNLNDNTFTVEGAKSMAKVLPKLQNLEVINFGDCLVRTEGAKILAKALSTGHQKLRELNLSGNEIGKSGALMVAECLEDKANIELLDLDSNQLGEEGIEIVQATMDAIGKQEILGSFSGDEGEDADEEDEYEDSYEDEEAVEDVEGAHVDDPELQVRGKALSPKQKAKDFLSFPSPEKLKQHGIQLTEALKDEIASGAGPEDVEKSIIEIVNCCCIVTEEDKKTKQTMCEVTDALLKNILEHGEEETPGVLANAILVALGLLKGENKKYRPPNNITGPLIVLEHVIRQGYLPRSAMKLITAFMDKPNPLFIKSADIRNKLLQTLYSM